MGMAMNGNRKEFLKHLEASRRDVERWPSWKQEALKAASDNERRSTTQAKLVVQQC